MNKNTYILHISGNTDNICKKMYNRLKYLLSKPQFLRKKTTPPAKIHLIIQTLFAIIYVL